MNAIPQNPHPPESGSQPPETIGAATARAPGVCGELVQGMLGDDYFLVTCPVDFFARVGVEVHPDRPGVQAPPNCSKAAAAVGHTLRFLGRQDIGATVSVSNPIPRGKGFGSSTADVAAAIAATANALGERLSPQQIGHLALQVEPSDGVMYPGIALFDHREGRLAEELGSPPPVEILAFDFGGQVDTLEFNREDRRRQWQGIAAETGEALAMVREGLVQGDASLLGQGATRSALAAQQVLFKPRLPQVLEFADSVGAVGVNVAHSGTVIGVLLDATQRRGKSTYRRARQAFPEAEAIYHLRLLGGGVQLV